MKDIKAIKGKYLIERLVAEGEHLTQDFKYKISDARKIARSISAFANHAGGHLLIGVKDNGTIAGVSNEEDIYVVEQAAQRYCQPEQNIEFAAYKAGNGVVVVSATVTPAESRPVMCRDTDNRWRAFYRVADENIVADPLMVKAWQLSAEGRAIVTSPDSIEQSVLQAIDLAGDNGITARQLAIDLHCSVSKIEKAVVQLVSMQLIQFNYTGQGAFTLICQR